MRGRKKRQVRCPVGDRAGSHSSSLRDRREGRALGVPERVTQQSLEPKVMELSRILSRVLKLALG